MSEIYILNNTTLNKNLPPISSAIMQWETCRRQIFFSDAEGLEELQDLSKFLKTEILQGLAAEQFMLEILCGLHSALVAETEVFGQFRDWFHRKIEEQKPLALRWNSRWQLWLSEVKKIRETYLCGTGSQSYGSLLRKGIPEGARVAFVGAGQLTQECLPWLSERNPLQIWVRNFKKYSELNKNFDLKDLSEINPTSIDCLIVAAPLSEIELKNLLTAFPDQSLSQVFDLRRDSIFLKDSDLFRKAQSWNHLDQFISQFESQQEELLSRVKDAKKAIERWRLQQEARVQVRPFGWDDLWS